MRINNIEFNLVYLKPFFKQNSVYFIERKELNINNSLRIVNCINYSDIVNIKILYDNETIKEHFKLEIFESNCAKKVNLELLLKENF